MSDDTPLDDEGLRRAFQSAAEGPARGTAVGSPDEHPAAEEIWRAARGEAPLDARRRVIDHLAVCAACSEDWRLAFELASVSEPPVAPPVRSSRALGPRRRSFGRGWAIAAAAVLAVVGLAFFWRGEGLWRATDGTPILRGAEDGIRSLVPAGPLARSAARLTWTPGPPGTLYEVLVTDGDLATVVRVRGLVDAELVVPADDLADLAPGAELLWRVEAELPDGERQTSPTFIERLDRGTTQP